MEDETRAFLILIVQSISIVLLWMMANVFIGIYKGFAFFETSPSWKNIIYYIGMLGTLFLLIRHLRHKWQSWESLNK